MTRSTVVLDSPEAIQRHLRCDIEPDDFDNPGVRFVLCDGRNEVRAHFHITDAPPDATEDDYAFMVSVFAQGMANDGDDGAMLLALTRPGPPTLSQGDRLWFRAAHEVCAEHDVRLLGVHVVTPRGQREVLLDDAL